MLLLNPASLFLVALEEKKMHYITTLIQYFLSVLVLQNYTSVLGQRQTKERQRGGGSSFYKERMMVEERRFLSATTFSAMDPSSQIH